MPVELSNVRQGNVFFLKTHYAERRHLSHICISNKVENLHIYWKDNKVLNLRFLMIFAIPS